MKRELFLVAGAVELVLDFGMSAPQFLIIWWVTLRCVGMSVGLVFCWGDVDWEGAAWLCPRSEGMPREGEKVAVERA